MQVVGIEVKKGEYEGFQYDNTVFHCVDGPLEHGFGNGVKSVKIKSKFLKGSKLDSFIARDVAFLSDGKNIIGVTCLDSERS